MGDSITVNEQADKAGPWETCVASCLDAPGAEIEPDNR